jgi:hypothetical protein
VAIRITRRFLWVSLLSPILGAVVAFYMLFAYGDPYIHEGPSGGPDEPMRVCDFWAIAFFLWTVFVFLLSAIYLFLDYRNKNISGKKFQSIYIGVAIAPFFLIAGILFEGVNLEHGN